MADQCPSSLVFSVQRSQPELVTSAKATPREMKLLSDIDDQDGLRAHMPLIQFYRSEPSMSGKDPAQVIREALAKTLVFYYPFAGRLREGPGRKLIVDCNDEGVLFIEADADVTLEQFGDNLQPPFPCSHELIYDVPGSGGVLDSPLLLIQVTRLKCNGFICGLRFNHTMCDAVGIVQFMKALAEIAHGAIEPSILPVWQRDLLSARDPPRITCTHHEYEEIPYTNNTIIPLDHMKERSFFFGPKELAIIRRRFVPDHLGQFSTYEIIAACIWRCRTIALQFEPNELVRLMVLVNARGKFNPPIPVGYYGNGVAFSAVVTTVSKLCKNPFEYLLGLVKKAKSQVTEEYMHSVVDLMVTKGRPRFSVKGSFILSDLTRAGYTEVDFGWGKAVYGGPSKAGIGDFTGGSFCNSFKSAKGNEGIIVPISLPTEAMVRFAKELDQMLGDQDSTLAIKSSL